MAAMRVACRSAAVWAAALLATAAAASLAPVAAQTAATTASTAPPRPALDLHEEVITLAVKVRNRFGREVEGSIPVTSFKPAGSGPFPLVVMNHGRSGTPEERATMGRARFEPLARYLVSKGFAVLVPTRLGYGEAAAFGDPEDAGACGSPQREVTADAAAEQTLALLAHVHTLPWIDASRWVAMGQSVGGLATVALVGRNPAGLVAAINFAGGSGGRPRTHATDPCAPERIAALWKQQAAGARIPMLWVYWRNDRFWGAELPQRWAEAWKSGGGQLEFHLLPEVGEDGHAGLGIDMDRWVPIAEDYLARAGFATRGQVVKPPASSFAALDDAGRLPAGSTGREAYARQFLAAAKPRAFAIGAGGAWGWSRGDWAMGRALGLCQARSGRPCRLYAVDDDVVW